MTTQPDIARLPGARAGWVLSLVLLLSGLFAVGCKSQMATPPPDDTADMSTAETCDNMKCLDTTAICCLGEPCVDTKTNVMHCGGCGKACRGSEVCQNSSCVCRAGGSSSSCGGSQTCCADRPGYTGGCRSLDTDTANCGGCGRTCKDKETCSAGACKCGAGGSCTGSQACCGSGCADLSMDTENCGMCGKKCAPGKACKNGTCEGECTGCAMGETCCNGKCANLLNDPQNCNMCGKTCPVVAGVPLPCTFGICWFGNVDGGGAPDMGRDM